MNKLRSIYFTLNKGSNLISKVLEVITAILVVVCILDILLQVFYRFVLVKYFTLPFSFTFTDELSRYSLIWITYLSLGMCLKEGYMTSIDFLYNHLGSKAKLGLYFVIFIIMAIFIVVTVVFGVRLVNINSMFKSSSMRLPGIFLFSAPIIGSLLMAYEMLTELMGIISGELKPFSKAKIDSI